MNKTLLFLLSPMFFIVGCTEQNTPVEESQEPEKAIIITTTATYALDKTQSTTKWKRYLHQGKTKTTMRVFGAMTEIELGEIKMNTEGAVDLVEGVLVKVNDSLSSGNVVFDLTTMKINTNRQVKEDDLFKTKTFPHSELKIMDIVPDSSGYMLKTELIIANTAKEQDVFVDIEEVNEGLHMTGSFTIQTLDWPLRDPEAKKIVKEDEITVTMDLLFKTQQVISDTVTVYQ